MTRYSPVSHGIQKNQKLDKTSFWAPDREQSKLSQKENLPLKFSGTKSPKHPAHRPKTIRKPSASQKPHQTPNSRSPHHQKNR